MARLRRIARYLLWSSAALAFLFCLESLHLFASGLDRLTRDLQLDTAAEASLVYDRRGNLVLSFATEDRTNVPLDRVSRAMVSAVLAAEDRNFYSHGGMDFVGLVRAAWVDLKARAVKQGGSTITQQLIRNVLLTPDRNVERKIKEILLALRVERKFGKEQILEAYLNRIYFGDGHYGVEAAARGYFGKSAADLDAAESALLAGIIPCPSVCSPRIAPNMAKSRRDTVLDAMREGGSITDRAYTDARAMPIQLVPDRRDPYMVVRGDSDAQRASDPSGMYFLDAVRQQVMDQFGVENVLQGGLRIYTTLDPLLQRLAEKAVETRLAQLDKSGHLQGALVAIDPHTGEVLALVGGRDFRASPFNRAMQARRQPGSAFKPLLFAAAIEQGYAPSMVLTDIDTPVQTAQGEWLPSGAHEAEHYTLRQALTVSSNRAAVRLLQMVGISTTLTYARRLGISSPLPAVPSLALGTGEVTLLDLTSAYGVFADGGIIAPPTLITRVEDHTGTIIWQSSFERQPHRAIREGTAYLMSSILADVVNRGTGSRARAEGFKKPAAGKTGTTDDYADAWFVGYTPQLVAGVWFGYDQRKTIMKRGFAATVAVPAWARFMKQATEGADAGWFKMPPDVERIRVCRASGLRATSACQFDAADGRPNVYEDLFRRGTGPYETCPGHPTDPPAGTDATTVPSAVS
jgi:1A family penicillin-binding protein